MKRRDFLKSLVVLSAYTSLSLADVQTTSYRQTYRVVEGWLKRGQRGRYIVFDKYNNNMLNNIISKNDGFLFCKTADLSKDELDELVQYYSGSNSYCVIITENKNSLIPNKDSMLNVLKLRST